MRNGLMSIDFTNYSFGYISIEHNNNTSVKEETNKIFMNNEYIFKQFNEFDVDYIHKSLVNVNNIYEMDIQKYEKLYSEKNTDLEKHVKNIEDIIYNVKVPLEGNIFYYHQGSRWKEGEKLIRCNRFLAKQTNMFWCGTIANKKICEIGFNAGHSCLLLLLGRDLSPLEFTIFDINRHKYTLPCFEYIKSKFSHINFEFIGGNSIIEIPKWINANPNACNTYDIVHIDGGHSEECINNDFKNTIKLLKSGGIIIIDDTDSEHISKYVDQYLNNGNFKELQIMNTGGSSNTFSHRIIQNIN